MALTELRQLYHVVPDTLDTHASVIFNSILASLEPNGLPNDSFEYTTVIESKRTVTSPTNIGLLGIALIAARELGLLSAREAEAQAKLLCQTVSRMEMPRGPYGWYDTETAGPTTTWVDDGRQMEPWFSSVDTAFLQAGFYALSQAFPVIPEAKHITKAASLKWFYDKKSRLMYGKLTHSGKPEPWCYGAISEALIISEMGVGTGSLPPVHLDSLWRSSQILQQQYKPDWNYDHPHTVASWGGSGFEFLLPEVLVSGLTLAPQIWESSHYCQLRHQVLAADPETGVWGFSPSSAPTHPSGYMENGVPEMGLWGYPHHPVISPHIPYMALLVHEGWAKDDLTRLRTAFPQLWTDEFGFKDAVNTQSGEVSNRFQFLDQGMAFAALSEYLVPNCIRRYFEPLKENLYPHMKDWHY